MTRRNSFDIARAIMRLLQKERELPIHRIAHAIGSHWQNTERALLFLKEMGLVVEQRIRHPGSSARLFSLVREVRV